MPKLNPSAQTRSRFAIAARTLLAIGGGYVFAAISTASLAVALPLPRPQAVLAATQLSFALYCALVIWAFSARSVIRAWLVAAALCTVPALHLVLQGAWS
ncbi:membrane protein [Pseudomonas sp. 10-1B]|nr:membrane protein [Pseudomonas sp. 10-1B]